MEVSIERPKREMREMQEICAVLTARAVYSELVKHLGADWRRCDYALD
mgnify:CR=1